MSEDKFAKFVDIKQLSNLHGHICMGLAIGYRAGLIARQEFKIGRGADPEILAVIEENSCCEDAIQLTVNCSYFRRNLLFQKIGIYVFIFYNNTAGTCLRLELKPEYLNLAASLHELKVKVINKHATPDEDRLFHQKTAECVGQVLRAKDEDLFFRQQFDMAMLARSDKDMIEESLRLNTCPCDEDEEEDSGYV